MRETAIAYAALSLTRADCTLCQRRTRSRRVCEGATLSLVCPRSTEGVLSVWHVGVANRPDRPVWRRRTGSAMTPQGIGMHAVPLRSPRPNGKMAFCI